jgi:hypothetical protein
MFLFIYNHGGKNEEEKNEEEETQDNMHILWQAFQNIQRTKCSFEVLYKKTQEHQEMERGEEKEGKNNHRRVIPKKF